MRFFSTTVLKVFAIFLCVVIALAVASRWSRVCGLLLLPLDWPGLFFLGDEWEPRLGVWGARAAGVLFSIPGTYILAWLWCIFIAAKREQLNEGR